MTSACDEPFLEDGLRLEEDFDFSTLLGDESCETERRGGPGAGLAGDALEREGEGRMKMRKRGEGGKRD